MTFRFRSETDSGAERREHVRERTDVTAHIVLPGGETVKCHVRDFSSRGAFLSVASVFGLPISFELRAGGQTYRAEVVRRGAGFLGVRFA